MVEYKDHLQEEEEEALSLCDLPLDIDEQKEESDIAIHNRRSSSEPPEFFEFFSNFTSEMSSAEDIIFCGKLVPFKDLSPPQIQSRTTHNSHSSDQNRHSSFRRRSESLSGLPYSSVSRSNSINNTKLMMRNSRSLDYRRLERFSSSKTSSSESENSIDRNSSSRSIGRGESMTKRTLKPRWYVLMFGVVKPPAEMELSDIKSRQFRRNSSTMSKKPPVNKGSSSCRLLKVLSCRDTTSVAVTTPFYIPPPA